MRRATPVALARHGLSLHVWEYLIAEHRNAPATGIWSGVGMMIALFALASQREFQLLF